MKKQHVFVIFKDMRDLQRMADVTVSSASELNHRQLADALHGHLNDEEEDWQLNPGLGLAMIFDLESRPFVADVFGDEVPCSEHEITV
jgi:hypothetical protein